MIRSHKLCSSHAEIALSAGARDDETAVPTLASRLQDPKVAQALAWPGQLIECHSWGYELASRGSRAHRRRGAPAGGETARGALAVLDTAAGAGQGPHQPCIGGFGGDQTMTGLHPDNRRVRPTGRMIFYHLSELTLRIGSVTDPPTVQITRGVQLHLFDLLGTDITRTRRPQT